MACNHNPEFLSWPLKGPAGATGGAAEGAEQEQGPGEPILAQQGWLVTATQRAVGRANAPRAVLALGVVAALHQLSSMLYAAGVPGGCHLGKETLY